MGMMIKPANRYLQKFVIRLYRTRDQLAPLSLGGNRIDEEEC
jgi:hypothetical protein